MSRNATPNDTLAECRLDESAFGLSACSKSACVSHGAASAGRSAPFDASALAVLRSPRQCRQGPNRAPRRRRLGLGVFGVGHGTASPSSLLCS